jgi:thiol reductant ABC exporter CydD subunit
MNIDPSLLRQIRFSGPGLILSLLFGALGGVAAILWALCLSRIITAVFVGGLSFIEVLPLMKMLLGLILFRAGVVFASDLTASNAAVRIKVHLRDVLFRHIVKLGPAFTRNTCSGDLVSTIMEGIESLDAYFSQYLPQLVLAALLPLMILVSVFNFDLISGFVLLITAPLIPYFMILIGKASETLTKRQWKTLRGMSAFFLDTLQGLSTLKMLNISRERGDQISVVSETYRQTTMGVLRVTFLSALALEMLATLSTAIVAVEIGLRLLYGGLTFEQALFILMIAPEFYLPLRMLGLRFHAGMTGVTASQKIFSILNVDSGEPRETIPANGKPFSLNREFILVFNKVSYTYPGRDRPALHKVSFEIRSGTTTVLVGASGAGKSTIANVCLRFLHPQEGQVLLDGKSYDEMPADEWRTQIAWVPQHPYLFNNTIRANIALSNIGASFEDIQQAARMSFADEFINKLPAGYATIIGERGTRLSGGQAQCLALARAFLKNAPLLILDEPTASIDPELEDVFQQASSQLYQGRTVIIIGHRRQTALNGTQIIVMAQGRVVKEGADHFLNGQQGLRPRMSNTWVKNVNENNF